jgi:hypothetical protein
MSLITYICAFYHIPENKKNNLEHYQTHLPKTLEQLKHQRIVFFYEDVEILEYVKTFVDTNPAYFIPIYLKLTDLPTYEISQQLLECCKKQDTEYLRSINDHKGVVHYQREYLQSGEDSYRKVITVWTSKIGLIEKVIVENPFQTDTFAWVDVSISRINMQFVDIHFEKEKINTNICWANYKGERMYHSGGFLISSMDTWNRFIPIYNKKLEDIREDPYAHDEETIFHLIHKENREIFRHF